jgi:hypothetical protein
MISQGYDDEDEMRTLTIIDSKPRNGQRTASDGNGSLWRIDNLEVGEFAGVVDPVR